MLYPSKLAMFTFIFLISQGANVNARHLWGIDHLSQGPHQGSIDAHQLGRGHPIGLQRSQVHPGFIPWGPPHAQPKTSGFFNDLNTSKYRVHSF